MRNQLILTSLLLCTVVPATAQLSVAIGLPNVRIGINLPLYPQLVPVPGYPVYYAPELDSNYFFYDGGYWVYQDDNWYESSWYNGPWRLVEPEVVPLFVLRVHVRYYRQPPSYFRTWQADASPHWGEHWGNGWSQRRSGWDRWNRNSAPAPAPLPAYQRQYSGDRYPQAEQQQVLQDKNYRYRQRDQVARQQNPTQRAPIQQQRIEVQRSAPSPAPIQQQRADSRFQRQNQQPEQRAIQQRPPKEHEQESAPQERNVQREQKGSQPRGREKDHDKSDDRDERGR